MISVEPRQFLGYHPTLSAPPKTEVHSRFEDVTQHIRVIPKGVRPFSRSSGQQFMIGHDLVHRYLYINICLFSDGVICNLTAKPYPTQRGLLTISVLANLVQHRRFRNGAFIREAKGISPIRSAVCCAIYLLENLVIQIVC